MIWARNFACLIIAGFVAGILLASFIDFGWPMMGLFFVLALAFGVLFWWEKKKIFGVLTLIFIGVVLGLFRFGAFGNLAEKNIVNGQSPIVWLITTDPDRRDNTTRLIVGKILIITDNFTDYKYGDKIEITGKLQKLENFLTDKNKVFDYKNYLLVRGIEQISYYPKIKILARGQGSVIKSSLFALKNSFLNNLKLVLPEPSATLAGGLILGDKGGLGTKTENEFRQAGISHIIVLSGYNITIVAESVLKFFSWFSPAFSWLLGLFSIILLVIMTGGEAAAVRSAVMGAIALLARRYGRQYDAGVALIVAGFLMVLWNPRLLVFDFGFQLSFLATLGMIYLSPIVSRLIDKVSLLRRTTSGLPTGQAGSPEVALLKSSPISRTSFSDSLKELISTTTGAQLAVYPWLLYKAGNATVVGFISNILILPAVPFAMFASFITGIAGFISYYLSLLFSYPTFFLLKYILLGAHFFANLL